MAMMSTRWTHPQHDWELTHGSPLSGAEDAVVRLTARWDSRITPADPLPQPPDGPAFRHPIPNAFTLRIHEGPSCTEAEIVLDQVALEQLIAALKEARNWQGQ